MCKSGEWPEALPVYWQATSFGKLQALPTDAKPVHSSSWQNQDEAFYDVAEGIRETIEKLLKPTMGPRRAIGTTLQPGASPKQASTSTYIKDQLASTTSTSRLAPSSMSSAHVPSYQPTQAPPHTGKAGLYIAVIVTLILALAGVSAHALFFASAGSMPNGNTSSQGGLSQNTSTTLASPPPASPPVQPGTVLCRADWANGWSGGADWKQVSNMLVNDGTGNYGNDDSVALAPCQLTIANYSVEATIQYVRYGWGFGILARRGGGNGYKAWITTGGSSDFNAAAITLASLSPSDEYGVDTERQSLVWTANYQIDTSWHTYRFDLKDATLTLFVDGQKILSTTDTQYLSPGRVGLAVNNGSQINVKSFQVTAL